MWPVANLYQTTSYTHPPLAHGWAHLITKTGMNHQHLSIIHCYQPLTQQHDNKNDVSSSPSTPPFSMSTLMWHWWHNSNNIQHVALALSPTTATTMTMHQPLRLSFPLHLPHQHRQHSNDNDNTSTLPSPPSPMLTLMTQWHWMTIALTLTLFPSISCIEVDNMTTLTLALMPSISCIMANNTITLILALSPSISHIDIDDTTMTMDNNMSSLPLPCYAKATLWLIEGNKDLASWTDTTSSKVRVVLSACSANEKQKRDTGGLTCDHATYFEQGTWLTCLLLICWARGFRFDRPHAWDCTQLTWITDLSGMIYVCALTRLVTNFRLFWLFWLLWYLWFSLPFQFGACWGASLYFVFLITRYNHFWLSLPPLSLWLRWFLFLSCFVCLVHHHLDHSSIPHIQRGCGNLGPRLCHTCTCTSDCRLSTHAASACSVFLLLGLRSDLRCEEVSYMVVTSCWWCLSAREDWLTWWWRPFPPHMISLQLREWVCLNNHILQSSDRGIIHADLIEGKDLQCHPATVVVEQHGYQTSKKPGMWRSHKRFGKVCLKPNDTLASRTQGKACVTYHLTLQVVLHPDHACFL